MLQSLRMSKRKFAFIIFFFNIFYGMCSTKEKNIFLQYSSHLLTSSAVGNISRYFRRNPCMDFFHHSNFCLILEENGISGMVGSLVEEWSVTLSNQAQAHSAAFPHLYGLVLRHLWTVALLALLSEKTPLNISIVGCILKYLTLQLHHSIPDCRS